MSNSILRSLDRAVSYVRTTQNDHSYEFTHQVLSQGPSPQQCYPLECVSLLIYLESYYSLARGPRNDLRPKIQGAFQGAMLNTTPYGSLTTIALRSSSRIEGTEPCTVAISPAQLFNDSKASLKSNSKYGSARLNQRQSDPTIIDTSPSNQSPCYRNATDHPSF